MAYCGSFYVEKRRGEKMKRLWEYLKPYKRLAILAPILMLLEVGAELAMPKLMTFMINQGVGTGNTAIITKTGIEMLVIAIIGIIGGIAQHWLVRERGQTLDVRRLKRYRSFLSIILIPFPHRL